MKTIGLALLTLFIWENSLAATLWARKNPKGMVARFEGQLGYTQIQYRETLKSQEDPRLQFVQNGLRAGALADIMLLPPMLWLGGAVEQVLPPLGYSGHQIKTTTAKAALKLWIPARPANLSLLAEYFVFGMNPSFLTLAHEQVSRLRYGVQLDITSPSGQSLYAQWYPPLDDSGQMELAAGIQLKLSATRSPVPYALFNGAPLINIGYRQLLLPAAQKGEATLSLTEFVATVGVRF